MAAAILLILGAASVLAGAGMGYVGVSSYRTASAAQALERLSATSLQRGPIGQKGYIEGALSKTNPELSHGLVLYYESELYGFRRRKNSDGHRTKEPIWKRVDRKLPALTVEQSDGPVQIFGEYSVTFQGRDPSIMTTETLEPGVTRRFEGLRAGQTVVAIGAIATSTNGPGLQIQRLASGDMESFRAGEQSGATFALIAAVFLLLAGFIMLGVGVSQL